MIYLTTLLQPISKCYAAFRYEFVTFERQAVTAVKAVAVSAVTASEIRRIKSFQVPTV